VLFGIKKAGVKICRMRWVDTVDGVDSMDEPWKDGAMNTIFDIAFRLTRKNEYKRMVA